MEPRALAAVSRLLASERVPSAASEAERHTLFQRILVHETRHRPAIVVLDDAHYSSDSLRFVQRVLATAEQLPVLFLLTARSEDLALRPAGEVALESLLGSSRCTRLELGPLSPDDCACFVTEMLGFRADLRGRVIQRIQGNPLFAVQLVSDWVARGVLRVDAEGCHLPDDEPVSMPVDLRSAWDARLETFLAHRPAHHRLALEAAAVMGGPVDTPRWTAICERLDAPPEGLLRALLDQGLAVAGEQGWEFVHGMLREALQEGARASERWASLHSACASVLQAGPHDRSRLGRHLLAAGEAQATVELAAGLDTDMRSGKLARAEETAHLLQGALARAPMAARLAAALQRVQLARLRGRIHAAARELAWCEGALGTDESEPRLAALTATEWALVAYRSGEIERALERSATGEALARQVGAEDLVGRCLELRGRVLTDRAQWTAARQSYEEARAAYAGCGDELGVATCELGSAWVACSEGQLALAETLIRSGLETFTRLGHREQMGNAHNLLGELARASTSMEEAVQHYGRALELHDSCGATGGATIAELNLSLVLLGAGRSDEARRRVTRRLRTVIALGHDQFVEPGKLILLVCDAQQGRWSGWLEKLESVSAALAQSGQVHEDLARMAELSALSADDAGLSTEASAARRLAADQRLGLQASVSAGPPA